MKKQIVIAPIFAAIVLFAFPAVASPLTLGLNDYIKLSTDKPTMTAVALVQLQPRAIEASAATADPYQATQNGTSLIQLQSMTNEAKAIIAYQDMSGKEVIWLQTHDYLTYPDNRHGHFSIEASDAAGWKQTRLGVGYGADVVDVTVNQANLIVNRNSGMTNGNIVMTGGGKGGVLKHAGAFRFYPNYNTNMTYALQTSLLNISQLTISALGSDTLYVDDSLSVNGRVILKPKPLAPPQDGALEYDGKHLYFTIGTTRKQLD